MFNIYLSIYARFRVTSSSLRPYPGMCFRMRGFKVLVFNPSPISALDVKSPHLPFLRVNKLLFSNPTSLNSRFPPPSPAPAARLP